MTDSELVADLKRRLQNALNSAHDWREALHHNHEDLLHLRDQFNAERAKTEKLKAELDQLKKDVAAGYGKLNKAG